MQTSTIGFIGAGNMASCLIHGLVNNGYLPQSIWATNPSSEKLQQLLQQHHIHISQDNRTAAEQADALIFAVKPQQLEAAARELAPLIQKHQPLVISIAAGVTEAALQHWLGGNIAIVRGMPNTPAQIGYGATGLFANRLVSPAQKHLAEFIFKAVGIALWVDEETAIDKVAALSGSGPAYFFLLMEALEQGAVKLGLSTAAAHQLTLQTALGAANLAVTQAVALPALRQQVTSPGGTTAAAIEIFEHRHMREIVEQAMQAAYQRAQELAKNYF